MPSQIDEKIVRRLMREGFTESDARYAASATAAHGGSTVSPRRFTFWTVWVWSLAASLIVTWCALGVIATVSSLVDGTQTNVLRALITGLAGAFLSVPVAGVATTLALTAAPALIAIGVATALHGLVQRSGWAFGAAGASLAAAGALLMFSGGPAVAAAALIGGAVGATAISLRRNGERGPK